MVCIWARLVLRARPASLNAKASRRISPPGAQPVLGWRHGVDGVEQVRPGWSRSACYARHGGRRHLRSVVARGVGWSVAVDVVVSSSRVVSRMRSASRSPSERGVGSRSALSRNAAARPGAHRFGVGLPLPRRVVRLGCSTRAHQNNGCGGRAGQSNSVAAGALD